MNHKWLFQYFEQIAEGPDAVSHLRRFHMEYRNRVVQIPQTPSGKLVSKKSQMVSGQSQNTLPEPSVRISQTPSAKSAVAFCVKERLIELVEAALQCGSAERRR
jgi:hypothetical protein